jgi:hypothetical protein
VIIFGLEECVLKLGLPPEIKLLNAIRGAPLAENIAGALRKIRAGRKNDSVKSISFFLRYFIEI